MLLIFFFIFGLVIGSFLSALSYRYPKNISVLKGRSICDYCGRIISWYDNIPLISYLILKGKCRYCGKPISLRYPIIEFVTGFGFVILFLFLRGSIPQILYSLLIFIILELIFIIDFEYQIIPDVFTFFAIFTVVLYLLLIYPQYLFVNLFAGFAASLFLLLVNFMTRGRGMGLGDVKFAIFGGLLMGNHTFSWLMTSFLTGGIAGSILILIGKARLKDRIAFGPFLILGIALTMVLGDWILKFLNLYF